MTRPTEAIISKIQKLRALAQSDNLNEAAVAAATAERLIAEYRLSEAELELEQDIDEPITDAGYVLYESGRIIPWKSALACGLAKHYGIFLINRAVYPQGRKVSRYTMVGRLSDIQICQYQMAYLANEIQRLSDQECKGKGHVAAFSYCAGAVSGILSKMKEGADSAKAGASSTALVKIDSRYQEAEDFSKGKITVYKRGPMKGKPKCSGGGSKSQYDWDAYQKGREDGRQISINPGLEGSSGGTRALKS